MDRENIIHISLKRMKVAKIDAICGGRERERKGMDGMWVFVPFLGGG